MRLIFSTTTMSTMYELAKGVAGHGKDILLFAGYPLARMRQRGFSACQVRTYSWPVLMTLVANRMVNHPGFEQWSEPWAKLLFDRHVAGKLPNCDVFVGTSSVGLASGRQAKERGALWVCERPCTHILMQDELLREEYKRHGLRWPGIHPRVIDSELAEYAESDAVLVASDLSKRSLVQKGVPQEKIWMVPYGVKLSRFYPEGSPEPDQFHVLYVGQRAIRKGLVYLLEAFDKLEHNRKHLTLIGADTPDGYEIAKRARRTHGVTVLGPIPQSNLRGHMSRADVFVLPSVEDGYGMVVDQAMACGCPCVVSTHAGSADTVREGQNGFTFEARDTDRLYRILQDLASDREMRTGLRDCAIRTAQGRGDWAVSAKSFLELCQGAR